MDFDSVREDLLVAAVAAGGAVGMTLTLELVAGVPVPFRLRVAPLFVYFAYLFTRKGGPYGRYDTVRNWALLAALVTLGVAGYAVLL